MNSLAEKFDSTITWELGIIWYDYSHHSNHHLLSEGSAGLCPNVRGLSTWKSVFTRQQSWAQSQQQRVDAGHCRGRFQKSLGGLLRAQLRQPGSEFAGGAVPAAMLPCKKLRGQSGASSSFPWPRLDLAPHWCGKCSFSKTSSVEMVGGLDS